MRLLLLERKMGARLDFRLESGRGPHGGFTPWTRQLIVHPSILTRIQSQPTKLTIVMKKSIQALIGVLLLTLRLASGAEPDVTNLLAQLQSDDLDSLKHREQESFRAELLADALDEARFFGERAGFGGERGPGLRTAALRFFSFSRNLWHTIRIMEVQHGCPLRPRNQTLALSPSARSSLSNRVLAAVIIPTTNLLNRCRPISK